MDGFDKLLTTKSINNFRILILRRKRLAHKTIYYCKLYSNNESLL